MINMLIPAVSGILDKFVEDKDTKNKLAHEIATMAERQAHEQVMAQVEVNKEQAKHGSIFVAGARPFIMWVCGFALAYHFIIQPLLVFIVTVAGQQIELPVFEIGELSTILMGLLGLGGMRSYEKTKGVARGKL